MTTNARFATNDVLASWMRVVIATQRGDLGGAGSYARAAAKKTNWNQVRTVHAAGALHIYAVDFLPDGLVWIEPELSRIAMAEDLYYTLVHDEAVLEEFIDDALTGATGLKRISTDVGPYAAAGAARRRAEAQDTADGIETRGEAVDRLSGLENDLKAALTRLRTGDPDIARKALSQIQATGERITALQRELDRLKDLHTMLTETYYDSSI